MSPATGSSPHAPAPGLARNGLVVLAGIVVLGLGAGAAYYHWRQPRVAAELRDRLAAAPTTLEGRIAEWHRSCEAMIHHRLTRVARLSDRHPWLVTHRVRTGSGEPPEVWGIDVSELRHGLSRVEGTTVVVELPEPRLLGRESLQEEDARHVPTYAAGGIPDPRARLAELARWFLGGLPEALEKDVEGARLEVRVGSSSAGPSG